MKLPPKPRLPPSPPQHDPDYLLNHLLDFATRAAILIVAVDAASDDEVLALSVNELVLHPGFNIVGGVLADIVKSPANSDEFKIQTLEVIKGLAARKELAKRAAT
jgi:hypothetical protein